MLQRVRLAMQDDLSGGMLGGEVEVDETFVGGKAGNMHKSDKRRKNLMGGGPAGKAIVLGKLEREGKVRAPVIPDRTHARRRETARRSRSLDVFGPKGAHGSNNHVHGRISPPIVPTLH